MLDRTRPVAVAAVLVLSGCLSPAGVYHAGGGYADPPRDVLGWEDGYWYDEPLDVDAAAGPDGAELDALVARTMARVEQVRRLEFRESVAVEVISREQLRRRWGGGRPAAYHDWNGQVWEGLFLVAEDRNASEALDGVYGSTVQGYYAPGRDTIVLVSDDPDDVVVVDRRTLVHELVHALQDQHFGLGTDRPTRDGQLAASGLVEGDANYVQHHYERRCDREWDCVDRPSRGGSGGTYDVGVFATVFVPYSEGPSFVARRRQRGGWRAVDAAYADPPASTEQLLHPGRYPDDAPVDVRVPDRSGAGWERFSPPNRERAAERVGEAGIFVMLWNGGVVPEEHLRSDDALSPYEYDHPASRGWAGDALVPYRNGDRFGYVFRTEWESREDAREFRAAYVELLRRHGAERRAPGVYRIPDGRPFADAFRVRQDGTTVTVVNAPTVADLDAVHAEPGGRQRAAR